MAIEDIWNESLREIGYRKRIGSAYEGSEASKACLELHSQTRDELLRTLFPEFARRANVALTLLKGPPPPGGYNPAQPWSAAYPPPGWLYEYAYPGDCLEVRALIGPPGLWPIRDPRPVVFRVDVDASLPGTPPPPAVRVILCNLAYAVATYCARVTDFANWDATFTQLFVTALAKKLAVPLAGSLDLSKETTAELPTDAAVAGAHRG